MLEREYNVYVDSASYERMFEHFNFLAQVSISGAKQLSGKLCDGVDSLGFDPEIYPRYLSQKKAADDAVFRYKFCAKRHRIVFEIIDDAVHVYDVQDCRQHQNKSLV